MAKKPPVFKAQPGPQTAFVRSSADICIFGGAAGGGKTMALLLDAAALAKRYKNYGAVIFRKNSTQVLKEGGLWDSSEEVYPFCGGRGTKGNKQWQFQETGSTVTFAHLEHDKDRFSWQGAQIAYIGFDELTHFSEKCFWYMLSRNRSMTDGPTIMRATCNPDPDHFVTRLISWWIDQETGYAIPERSGVVRWFSRQGDDLFWADKKSELLERFGPAAPCQSLTFIPSKLEDNQLLLQKDPDYLTKLLSLTTVEREQLRHGNWKIRPTSGTYFKRHWFGPPQPDYPRGYRQVRYWDRAATEKTSENDPDWTVGVRMTRDPQGVFWVTDVVRDRVTPAGVEGMIRQTAIIDGPDCEVVFGIDPGSAGKMEAAYFVRMLAGYSVKGVPVHKDKETLCKPASSQAEAGNMRLVAGDWNESYLNELVNFPEGKNDDQVDATSGAFNELALGAVPITPDNYVLSSSKTSFTGQNFIFKPTGRI